MKIATEDSWYETAAVGDGVTHIWEPHVKPFYRCNVWHLRGRDRDLLIDSGMGVVSLREKVALVAERAVHGATFRASTAHACVSSTGSIWTGRKRPAPEARGRA